MSRFTDYNISDLNPDDLYKLLPYVVRAKDPNDSIRVVFNALASLHNYAVGKLRELPRLQDPALCAKFSPADFGESVDDYREYLTLVYQDQLNELSDGQKGYMETFANRIPKSLEARNKELKYLSLLGESVGVKMFSKFTTYLLRGWVQTAIYRSHLKGTNTLILLIGRILGFVDIQLSELWSRYSIKDPANPPSTVNDPDFSYVPDEYPYRPQSGVYGDIADLEKEYPRSDGQGGQYDFSETVQVPYGSITYNPNVLDDGPDYKVTFEGVNGDITSTTQYNLVVNNHNPFGNFTSLVDKKLYEGVYALSGGSGNSVASVSIPSEDRTTSYTFMALSAGEWGNKIVLSVKNVTSSGLWGTPSYKPPHQNLTISGTQSLIKFKTSFFDLLTSIDPIAFSIQYPPIPVTPNMDLTTIGKFTYSVDVLSNTLNAVVSGNIQNVVAGDSIIITNSTSQYDSDGYEVNRSRNYIVQEILSTSSGSGTQTEIKLGLSGGENCTFDINALGLSKVEVSTVSNDGFGNAVFGFSTNLSTSNSAQVTIIGSHSGIYDGTYEVDSFNPLSNNFRCYNSGATDIYGVAFGYPIGLVPYSPAAVTAGYALFKGGGWANGVVPFGTGSEDVNGTLLKVLPNASGAFPVLGTDSGHSKESINKPVEALLGDNSQNNIVSSEDDLILVDLPDNYTNYEFNLKAYFEALTVIRQLVEEVRPITRTLRRETDGFALKDKVNYAPLLLIDSVVLESQSGKRYKMRVDSSLNVFWEATTDTPNLSPIVQKDPNDNRRYQWGISDFGNLTLIPVVLPEVSRNYFSVSSDSLVFYKASNTISEKSAYVTLKKGALLASANESEDGVDSIHLVNNSENYLSNILPKVTENILDALKPYFGPSAFSSSSAPENFSFQVSPEDELVSLYGFADFAFGHVSTPWMGDVKLEFLDGKIVPVTPITTNNDGFIEGLYSHHFNNNSSSSWSGNEFRGADPRWDDRGIQPALIEPVPSASSAGYGLDENYPIAFLNFHNTLAWRDRVTNMPVVSHYSHSSAASNMGCDRVDVDISYLDGPIEPMPSTSSASNVFYSKIDLQYPWKQFVSGVIAPPNRNYTSLVQNGSWTNIVFPNGTDLSSLYVGLYLFFTRESNYTGVYQILGVGTNSVAISSPYNGNSTSTDKTIWVKYLHLDMWQSGATNKGHTSMKPLVPAASGTLPYSVFVNSTNVLDNNPIASVYSDILLAADLEKVSTFSPEVALDIPTTQQKRTMMLCIRCGDGAFPVYAKLSQDAAEGILSNADVGGSLCWDTERDALQVTLMPASSSNVSALTFSSSDVQTISSSILTLSCTDNANRFVEVASPITRNLWRGGFWS